MAITKATTMKSRKRRRQTLRSFAEDNPPQIRKTAEIRKTLALLDQLAGTRAEQESEAVA